MTLQRVCWLTGLVGMLAMMALGTLLSQWTFGSSDHALEIALLGVAILMGNLSGGQMALIQGMRRIGDLARLNVISAAAGTVIAIGCYTALDLHGIVLALLLMAMVNLAASWYYARRAPAPEVVMSWRESLQAAGGLIRLGLVFMWNGLIGSLVAYLTVTLITQSLNLAAVGIFSAAFALSGMFVGFVLNAMGADYYPRLTAVANDRVAVNRLVNDQTEIGLLLAAPGLLATLCLAPWIIRIFYTEAFLPAADLLQWFILGCLGRVVSWPLGFVMLALGKGGVVFRHRDAVQRPSPGVDRGGTGHRRHRRGGDGVFYPVFGLYSGGVWSRPPSDRLSLVGGEPAAIQSFAAHHRRGLHRCPPVAAVAGNGIRHRRHGGNVGAVPAGTGAAHRPGSSHRPGGVSGAGSAWVLR